MAASILAVAAGVLVLAVDALYVGILLSEGEGDLREPISIFFASVLFAAAVLLIVGGRQHPYASAVAAVVLAACAVPAVFSIGLLLVPSIVLALLASARASSL